MSEQEKITYSLFKKSRLGLVAWIRPLILTCKAISDFP